MTAPRFFIITNDARRAALEFWCHPGNLPPSLRVIDDPFLFDRVPDGAKYQGLWYGTASAVAPWRNFWLARHDRGGVEAISEDEWSRIKAWAARRRAEMLALLYGGAEPEPLCEVPAPGQAAVHAPAMPAQRQIAEVLL